MDTIDLKGMEDSINSGLGILSELEDKFKNNINIVVNLIHPYII
jgi:hypothetical protein